MNDVDYALTGAGALVLGTQSGRVCQGRQPTPTFSHNSPDRRGKANLPLP